jgi:hypothetical protein
MYLTLFAVLLLQSAALPAEWIQIARNQTEFNKVVNIDAKRLRLQKCREAEFASTGLDAITESSFTTVVAVVVDRSGEVERFRVVRGPEIAGLKLSEPIRLALTDWRYRAAGASLAGPAFEIAVVFPKPLGASKTTACRSK